VNDEKCVALLTFTAMVWLLSQLYHIFLLDWNRFIKNIENKVKAGDQHLEV
jgi:hypothetical protein